MTAAAVDAPTLLRRRLADVERRVRALVDERRARDPDPDDPHRGLFLTSGGVARVLATPSPGPDQVPWPDSGDDLRGLVAAFGLSPLDVEFLLVALAPDLDARFEQLYGYLNDDLTRRRATVGLALALHGQSPFGAARARLAPGAPLVAGGLVEVHDPDRPSLTRTLRVPDRVLAHLLGEDDLEPRLAALASVVDGPPAPEGFVHLRATEPAVAGLTVDAKALAQDPDPDEAATALVREARLRGCPLVVGPVSALAPDHPAGARLLRVLTAHDVPLVLHGPDTWDPTWTARTPLTLRPGPRAVEDRAADWRRELADPALAPELARYRLSPRQITAAASVARRRAAVDARPVTLEDVREGVRSQNAAGLERLARHIVPAVGWADLVLPDKTRDALVELEHRARHRDTVLGTWRMRPGGGRGRGVTALFAGESGTGKTMSAEVVAAALGMDLYVVDLSTVVDKYVGETEKNLERIFTEAAGVNGVLLFDEADAIFGKRSAVQDAHDRHANVESAYLLQRMESFDGIAVLTTNLRANLDEAFTRRLDVIADFPLPDAAQREALWDRCLGSDLPRAHDLDLAFCARFELAGGSIRACAVTAAYRAATAGEPVSMADLVTAVEREYRKLGRLVRAEEFEAWR